MDQETLNLLNNFKRFMDNHYDDIVTDRDGNLQIYAKKALVDKIKDFRIEVYPNDHGNPDHFHIVSKQRGLNIRLNIYTLEPLSKDKDKISSKELRKIQFMLCFPSSLHEKILRKFKSFHS